jgi:hypothetical protein
MLLQRHYARIKARFGSFLKNQARGKFPRAWWTLNHWLALLFLDERDITCIEGDWIGWQNQTVVVIDSHLQRPCVMAQFG